MAKIYFMQDLSGYVFTTEHPSYHKSCEIISAAKGKAAIVERSKQSLLKYIKPGVTLYTVIRKVSASGMSRCIDVYAIADNKPVYLSGYASNVLGWKLSKDRGIVVGGCGMDMGFHLVYSLCSACGVDYQSVKQEWL